MVIKEGQECYLLTWNVKGVVLQKPRVVTKDRLSLAMVSFAYMEHKVCCFIRGLSGHKRWVVVGEGST